MLAGVFPEISEEGFFDYKAFPVRNVLPVSSNNF